MRKIIFLDFDGVLNTESHHDLLISQGKQWLDEYGSIFDPQAVEQLGRIVEATNADIVIESSWKEFGFSAMLEMWETRNLPGRLIGVTSSKVSDEWLLTASLDEFDPPPGHCKGMEIAAWLAANADDETTYVIIDDEPVALDRQEPHLVMTNPFDGLTAELAGKAIQILNR